MTDWREELIETIALQIGRAQFGDWVINPTEKMREQARAALAVAEPVIREQADNALREENARLREELQKDFNAMRVFRRYRELEAEIETLRGLLREAHVKMDANNLWSNLRNRVAAAIREGGND